MHQQQDLLSRKVLTNQKKLDIAGLISEIKNFLHGVNSNKEIIGFVGFVIAISALKKKSKAGCENETTLNATRLLTRAEKLTTFEVAAYFGDNSFLPITMPIIIVSSFYEDKVDSLIYEFAQFINQIPTSLFPGLNVDSIDQSLELLANIQYGVISFEDIGKFDEAFKKRHLGELSEICSEIREKINRYVTLQTLVLSSILQANIILKASQIEIFLQDLHNSLLLPSQPPAVNISPRGTCLNIHGYQDFTLGEISFNLSGEDGIIQNPQASITKLQRFIGSNYFKNLIAKRNRLLAKQTNIINLFDTVVTLELKYKSITLPYVNVLKTCWNVGLAKGLAKFPLLSGVGSFRYGKHFNFDLITVDQVNEGEFNRTCDDLAKKLEVHIYELKKACEVNEAFIKNQKKSK